MLFAVVASVVPVAAQNVSPSSPLGVGIQLDLPLLDLPYNTSNGGRAPSMHQTVAASETFYEVSHTLIQRAWGTRTTAAKATIALWDLFDLLAVPLPGGSVWAHEEFHRAVMGNRGIDSFNDVYKFNVGATVIAVSRVRDDDLVRLKRDHPADQIRLGVAGIEGEHQVVQALQKNQFFERSSAWHQIVYWVTKASTAGYVISGTSDSVNADTDQFNADDGAEVEVRDFTGHDFTAWVYDLHRPDEPYAARGVHPSGVGIDRYIKLSDLTDAEQAYLHRQGRLHLLNFVDPFLFRPRGFTVTNPLDGGALQINANLGHWLTSFGRSIDTNLFLRQGQMKVFAVFHHYANGERWFPGLDVSLIDFPMTIGGYAIDLTPRIAWWLQPDGQRFRATRAAAGGLVGIKLHRAVTSRLGGFVEVEAKSAGWVAGNVHLDSNVSARVGLSFLMH